MKALVPLEVIEKKILLIGGVTTKRLNEQVRRNLKRPADFMYQLSREEFESLRSHFATSSSWGGRRTMPYVFTERRTKCSPRINIPCRFGFDRFGPQQRKSLVVQTPVGASRP